MKKTVLTLLSLFAVFSYSFAQDDLCTNLKKILDGGNTQFTGLRGEATSKQISGVARPFFVSTSHIGKDKGYVNDSNEYPAYEEIIAISNVKGDVPEAKLVQEFESYKEKIKACFAGNADWKLMEKDKTNDLYLEDTNFRKLVGFEAKKGPKVKFELYMYNNRVAGHWCIELNVEGIGK